MSSRDEYYQRSIKTPRMIDFTRIFGNLPDCFPIRKPRRHGATGKRNDSTRSNDELYTFVYDLQNSLFTVFFVSLRIFIYARNVDRQPVYRVTHQCFPTLPVRHHSNPLLESIISSTYDAEHTKRFHLRIRFKSNHTTASLGVACRGLNFTWPG